MSLWQSNGSTEYDTSCTLNVNGKRICFGDRMLKNSDPVIEFERKTLDS